MNDTKIKISACLVVYNDADFLPRCLDSIVGVVDEIIIVNDGPLIDAVDKIAEQYGARLIIAPRVGVAEPLRHLSYEAAHGEWILQIDADEYLSEELRQSLPSLVNDNKIDAYEFIWPIYNGKNYLTKTWPYKRALFRKTKMSFLGLPNYIVEINGQVKKVPFRLEHKPNYNNYSWPIFKKKWLAWANIQANLYLQDFSKISKFQYNKDNWPRNILLRKQWSIFIAPFDAIMIFTKTLFPLGWRQGFIAWKMAMMFASFRLAIDWYIYTNKNSITEEHLPDCLCGKRSYKIFKYKKANLDFKVLSCISCGLARTWPEPIEIIDSLKFYNDYDDYKERAEHLPLRIKFANKILKIINQYFAEGKLLDVGCNLGVFVNEAFKKGYQAEGVDLSKEAILEGKKMFGLDKRLHCGYIDQQDYLASNFEIITYLHCLEHINNPEAELSKTKNLMADSSLLVIEVPNFNSVWRRVLGASWYGFSPSQHIWQFTKSGLVNLLKRSGFKIVTAKTHFSLYHKINFSPAGLAKIILYIIAYCFNQGDDLIVIARK